MSLAAFLIALAYLLTSLRYRLTAAGAFAVPAVVALILLARLAPAEASVPAMGRLGQAHILLATLGVAVFAFAAALAIVYLFQDRSLKRKQLDRADARGTPLETLDRLAHRCVSIGFPVFTLAIVTGAIWVARLGLLHGHGDAAPRIPDRRRDLGRVRGADHRPGRRRLARAARGLADAGRLRRHGAGGGGLLHPPRGVDDGRRDHRSAARRCFASGPRRSRCASGWRSSRTRVAAALAELTALAPVREAVMLSTCNRVELYVAVDDADRAAAGLAEVLARRAGVAVGDLAEHLYQHRDAAAVRHLFRVASSLDSLVVGEPQILGQTKQAHDAAVQHGTAGAVLRTCFEEGAFRVARRVRRETAIARNPVSVSSVAVDFARQVVGDFARRARADRRRGQDVGAGGAHAAHARRDADGHQPDARARGRAGPALRRRRRRLERPARRAHRGRHRHRVDGRAAAGADAGADQGGAQGAPRPPALSARHRRPARRRSGGGRARPTSTCSTSTPSRSRRASTAPSAKRRRRRPRRSSRRSWAGS